MAPERSFRRAVRFSALERWSGYPHTAHPAYSTARNAKLKAVKRATKPLAVWRANSGRRPSAARTARYWLNVMRLASDATSVPAPPMFTPTSSA